MRTPLRIRKLHGIDGKVACYEIRDALDRSIKIYCEDAELRREVAKLFSPAEAEALAKWIARAITALAEQNDVEEAIDMLIASNSRGVSKR